MEQAVLPPENLAFQPGDPMIVAVESQLLNCEQAECPVVHRFVPNLYIREIFMPANTLVASKIHKTRHPFVVLEGSVSVYCNGQKTVILEAGHMGITEPGTHRLLFTHEDTRWVTFHPNPTNETDLKVLEESIIEFHDIPLCPGSPQPLQ